MITSTTVMSTYLASTGVAVLYAVSYFEGMSKCKFRSKDDARHNLLDYALF